MKIVLVLYGVFAQFLSKISPLLLFQFIWKISSLILFFDGKQPKKDDVPPIKTVTFYEYCRCIIWGFCPISVWNLTFCSFSIYLKNLKFDLIFWRKTTKKGRCASHKKTLHYMKIVALSYGVFAQFPSEISPFVLFEFMSKNSCFGHVPCIENVTFCENCRCIIGVVCSNYVWNLTFCSNFW